VFRAARLRALDRVRTDAARNIRRTAETGGIERVRTPRLKERRSAVRLLSRRRADASDARADGGTQSSLDEPSLRWRDRSKISIVQSEPAGEADGPAGEQTPRGVTCEHGYVRQKAGSARRQADAIGDADTRILFRRRGSAPGSYRDVKHYKRGTLAP